MDLGIGIYKGTIRLAEKNCDLSLLILHFPDFFEEV